jgi:mannose-6-phosphate isomerase-like protein (cupin superfamily)
MTPSFKEFESDALRRGFDEVLERRWAPDTQLDTHTHPFDASALVVQGEMWLTVDGRTQHLLPGGTFEVARGTPHQERYGAQGATYWVARRGPSA